MPTVKTLMTFLAVFLFNGLLRLVNLRKQNRGRQILTVAASFLFALAGVLLGVFFMGSTPEQGDIDGDGAILQWNLAIVGCFLLGKLILCPLSGFLFRRNERMRLFCERWYAYDPGHGQWFLRPKARNLRVMWSALSWTMALISALLLAWGWNVGSGSSMWLRVYPCAAMLVVTEIYNFLGGPTKPEHAHDIGGADVKAVHVGAYYKLRQVYEKLFPGALLFAYTGNEYPTKEGSTARLKELRDSSDPVDRAAGGYFSHLGKKDGFFDVDLIHAANRLLHRESVVVFHPFYRDLDEYMRLPLVHNLIENKKCLIVVGRGSLEDDVTAWAEEMLREYSKTRYLWRVSKLGQHAPDCEVGILTFSQLYDLKVLHANTAFWEDTGFVLLIEPSKMMTTSQAGLGIVVEKMKRKAQPVYCVCDREVDGLVDTMSHILQTSLTHVIAAPIPRSVYTAMGWAATGDYLRQKLFSGQTHYLGGAVELAAVALRNQVPQVSWYGAQKAPVQDIRWIAGQYFSQICKYAHIPGQQKCLEERISFSSNLWEARMKPEAFVIAEDEFCNLFASVRMFLTRGTEHSYVNVISENYLLRDYMRCNARVFLTDPKVIPALAPHYAKTERNTVLRLILMMASQPVSEAYIAHELSILGKDTDVVYEALSRLIQRYTFVKDTIVTVQNQQMLDEELVPYQHSSYSITRQAFEENFAGTLKNACFVVENERFETEYLDARLFAHITQTVMPGQLLTHNGKLYQVHAVSPQVGCILHRAADLYTRRHYYRQVRTYHLDGSAQVVSVRRVMDLEIVKENRSFSVTTSGYLDMRDNDDLRTARFVDLSHDPGISAYDRSYKNKNVLRLHLPGTDGPQRYTICLLLTEMLRTVFPDAWPYIAVLCAEQAEGALTRYTYGVQGDVDQCMIYILEDSEMDLGLLEAIDKNLMRLFEIMSDYLQWHFEKLREPAEREPFLPADVTMPDDLLRGSLLQRLARYLSTVFSRKEAGEIPAPPESPEEAEPPAQPEPAAEAQPSADPEEELVSRYSRECYLKLGFDAVPEDLALTQVAEYLAGHGWADSALTKARRQDEAGETILDMTAENHCDFCGVPLSGVSFTRLSDGRVRCNDCSMTAVNSVSEFRELFSKVTAMMACTYGLSFPIPIAVRTTDAHTIGRLTGKVFVPSVGVTARVLGFAQRKGGQYNLFVENGSPRLAAMDTTCHELTHIWQYLNWDDSRIRRLYGSGTNRDMVYEGMAMWSAVQLLYALGETTYARMQELLIEQRQDVYGVGFRLYRDKYGFVYSGEVPAASPFTCFPPL